MFIDEVSEENHYVDTSLIKLSKDNLSAIKYFLQGAVSCWCNVNKSKPFKFCDLMGQDNKDWNGTPLQELYDEQMRKTNDKNLAAKEAAKEAGLLLKEVIKEDKRHFNLKRDNDRKNVYSLSLK